MSADTPPSLYRLIKASSAALSDFDSVMVSESRAPNSVELARPELWAGISMFDSEAGARSISRGKPQRGTWIARVDVDLVDPAWIVIGFAGRRGHRTIWASPRRLLAAVVTITPV